MGERKIFQNSVVPLPAQTGLTQDGLMVNAVRPQPQDDEMNLHFSLSIAPDVEKQLEERVSHGEVLSQAELDRMFNAKQSDVQVLASWLKDNGYQITHTAADGIYARAQASKIAQTLDVNMVPVTKDGVTYTAAQNAPSLPIEVAAAVQSINGLQPFRRAHKHLRKPAWQSSDVAHAAAAAAPAIAPPYMVSDILRAYNADTLGATGLGQTIAILIDTVPDDGDLLHFWAANHVAVTPGQIEKINVPGGTLPPPSEEETLDASWASSIAPGAHIRIYAAGDLKFVSLDRALDKIIEDLPSHPGMRQLSISLGLGERFMSPDEVTTQHTKFLRLAAAGVNVFVSSGDAGSNPDANGHSLGPLQAEYSSSDSAVIGVGGTSLTLTATGTIAAETGWAGSGGGSSRIFPRPSWQNAASVPRGSKRLVPDVSLVADPNTGAFLFFRGQRTAIGGTSWSAPVWAAFCALLNEARHNAGKPPLPFLNPLLYPLLGTAAFREITQGSNGAFECHAGYDQVTGIGTPNVAELLARLP